MPSPRTPAGRLARAKINLTLHVTGQRADGYHLLDSLVVFTDFGDRVALSDRPGLRLRGPMAAGLRAETDNLVTQAARLIGADAVGIVLDKRLPVASGMGGGSSDAAAALHLLAADRGLPLPDTAALMRLGADLPVCMAAPVPQRMQGLGERIAPVAGVPPLWLVLVNPGQALSTPAVFRALPGKDNPPMPAELPHWSGRDDFLRWLAGMRNDLEPPARTLVPEIGAVLDLLSAQPGCRLARMTGSGATCFGLFDSRARRDTAARALARPDWFVAATRSAGSVN